MDIAGICYAVTCNGAAVYDIATTKRVHGLTLPASAVEAVLELTKDDPIAYEAFLDGGAYTDWDYVDHPEKYAATQWTPTVYQKNKGPLWTICARSCWRTGTASMALSW